MTLRATGRDFTERGFGPDFRHAADPQSKASSQMAIDIGYVCLR